MYINYLFSFVSWGIILDNFYCFVFIFYLIIWCIVDSYLKVLHISQYSELQLRTNKDCQVFLFLMYIQSSLFKERASYIPNEKSKLSKSIFQI